MKNWNLNTNASFVKEDLASASLAMEGFAHTSASDEDVSADEKPEFRFGRLFADLPPLITTDESLIELGKLLFLNQDLSENPSLPAGYTFLGQFVAHDISLDVNLDIPSDQVNADEVENVRSPFLDLENLYGAGPSESPDLYNDDQVHLKIGDTEAVKTDDADRVYHNDLPRENKIAIVNDFRSDENLALAQTHVAFIKFHNSVVDRISQDSQSPKSVIFEAAREKVIQHYQWIVLQDFLPKIIEADVLKDALKNGSMHFNVEDDETPFIPVEFSLGAFRVGHSMLIDSYEWNRVFQSPADQKSGRAKFIDLLLFTGFGGLQKNTTLPSNWIIDWTRFFDFTGFNGIVNNPKFNYAKRFGISLTPALGILKNFLSHITKQEFQSLPVLDLIRGSRLGLPSGQHAAQALGFEPISPSEMVKYPFPKSFTDFEFDKKTPLWYYIMREAEIFHSGKRLGPVGSRIVAETFVKLIRSSPHSILKKRGWKPDLGQRKRNEFGMADLLVCANVVNPLGS
ncbi:MAG: heme peroxidase family protein [Blastocatellia bacterium]